MIDYICKPYRFTIGFAAYYLMLIYSVASLLLIYSLISSTERPLSGVIRALSFLALSLAGTVLSYYWILMSQRYFHFSDEGILVYDPYGKLLAETTNTAFEDKDGIYLYLDYLTTLYVAFGFGYPE